MINKSKDQLESPEFMELANIVTIYKGKGSRNSIENDRGIFILGILRMIKEKLIHGDISAIVDKNMSDSQIGSRPDRNIRNHLFVLNSIINSVVQKESPPVDVQVFDVKQCFDGLWLEECLNDLYENGLTSSNLNLLYEGNKECHLAINTPSGKKVT